MAKLTSMELTKDEMYIIRAYRASCAIDMEEKTYGKSKLMYNTKYHRPRPAPQVLIAGTYGVEDVVGGAGVVGISAKETKSIEGDVLVSGKAMSYLAELIEADRIEKPEIYVSIKAKYHLIPQYLAILGLLNEKDEMDFSSCNNFSELLKCHLFWHGKLVYENGMKCMILRVNELTYKYLSKSLHSKFDYITIKTLKNWIRLNNDSILEDFRMNWYESFPTKNLETANTVFVKPAPEYEGLKIIVGNH